MAEDKEKQQFAAQICRCIPINELPQQVQNEVINNANLVKVRKGGFLFKQGDRDGFSYYLIDGEIDMIASDHVQNTIKANTNQACYAMAQLQPRQFSAKARKPSIVMQISRDYLDKLLVLHDKDDEDATNYDLASAEVEVAELEGHDDVDWMTRMLQSELFSGMPTANIHALFALLEPVEYQPGDVVVKQGDPGEHYFIIQEGRCQVLRSPSSGGKEVKLAELNPGDSFGEEALITDTTRNATVSMITAGVLMRLTKDNFIELIRKPTLQAVSFARAQGMVKQGAQWLDVRYKKEYEQSFIEGSINIPLNVLRMQSDKLDKNKQYIVYCDTSGRSSTGAFLLAERGFKVSYLEGGILNHPGAAKEAAAQTDVPAAKEEAPAAKPEPKPQAKPEPKAAPKPEPAPAPDDEEEMDPDVKSSVLETELARTDLRIQDMEQRRDGLKNEGEKEIQAEVERRLKEERAKIETAMKEAAVESERLRKSEEEKLRKMKAEAEKRLQEEKKKIEEVYSRNSEEMEKLQRMKQEAEEQMRKDRARLEKEAEEAKKQLGEAQELKKQIQASKRAMEKEAEKRRKEQEELEKKIQQKAREKLEIERRKLAEQLTRNNDEFELAKKERAAADAARKAAKDEAARIIEEYKAKHDKARAEEEERLRAERAKLEEEQRKIRESLAEIEKTRSEAENAKKAAMAEVKQLRSNAQKASEDEMKAAEAKLNQANEEILHVQEAQEKAEHAQKLNEEDIAKRKAMEEELRKQLEADLESFKEQMEQEEKKFASISSQMEHMKRIKQQANAAKKAAADANQNLLSDVAAQLGKEDD